MADRVAVTLPLNIPLQPTNPPAPPPPPPHPEGLLSEHKFHYYVEWDGGVGIRRELHDGVSLGVAVVGLNEAHPAIERSPNRLGPPSLFHITIPKVRHSRNQINALIIYTSSRVGRRRRPGPCRGSGW